MEVPGEDAYPQYLSNAKFTKEEFIQKLKEKYEDASVNFEDPSWVEIKAYTPGKRVKTVKFGNKEISRSTSKNNIWIKVSKFQGHT